MLPTKFQVSWPFGSGGETKNRFSILRPSWISDRIDFSYFLSTSLPMLPTKFQVSLFQKKRKVDFQDSGYGGHLGFPD